MSKLEKIKEIILEELENYLTKHTLDVEEKHRLLTNLKLATEILCHIEAKPPKDDNWWPK